MLGTNFLILSVWVPFEETCSKMRLPLLLLCTALSWICVRKQTPKVIQQSEYTPTRLFSQALQRLCTCLNLVTEVGPQDFTRIYISSYRTDL